MSELNSGDLFFEELHDQANLVPETQQNTIDHKIVIDEHIKRTSYVIIQHLRNVVSFQDKVKMPWGYHSRFIERLLHPEDKLIYKGKSQALFNDMNLARRKEHIVPMNYLMYELCRLIEEDNHTDQELSSLLQSHLGIAYITQDEAKRLDGKETGLKCAMPTGWHLGVDDPLDRLKAIGIVLFNDNGQEVKTLINV